MEIEFELNGEPRTLEVTQSDLLLDVLRRHGYTGAKRGCDTGACGMCMVQVDGEPRQSCVAPAARVDGSTVETIEGLGTQKDLHPLQQAFVDHTAIQCGFCIPGMIMSARALLADNPDPTEQEVREALEKNLCRCTGYKKIVEAVLDGAERMRDDGTVAADGGRVSGATADRESPTCCSNRDCCDGGGSP